MSRRNGQAHNPLAELYQARLLIDKGIAPTDETFREAFPHLASLLHFVEPEKGLRADPAMLMISVIGGDWQFRLSSPSLRASISVMVKTYAEGLAALEQKLMLGAEAWSFNSRKKLNVRKVKKTSDED